MKYFNCMEFHNDFDKRVLQFPLKIELISHKSHFLFLHLYLRLNDAIYFSWIEISFPAMHCEFLGSRADSDGRSIYSSSGCSLSRSINRASQVMASLKKDILIGLAIGYGFLVMFIVFEIKENPMKASCDWENPCLRFCCKNKTLCKETKIRETINKTAIEHFDTKDFTILLGPPRCSSMRPLKDTEKWRLNQVRFD